MATPTTTLTAGLPDRVRKIRESSGKSARALAELCGLSEGHIRLLESGERGSPSGETLAKLARGVGVSLDWLATGTGPEPSAVSIRRAVERAERAAS